MVLYAIGHDSENTPGELERSALALVARMLSRHLEAGHSLMLAARVEAEQRANRKLRILLHSIERSLSLQGEGVESVFLEAARELIDGGEARYHRDLSGRLSEGNICSGEDGEGAFLALAFEHYRPKGILCRKPPGEAFKLEDEEWLSALLGFAETVFENRRLHGQVQASLQQLRESQAQLIRSSQWAAAGRLAANAAHELNTPLGAIKLAAETAHSFLGDGPRPTVEGLKLIQRSVDRCKKVTERLLIYSKPKEEKDIEEFSLESVVQDSLSSLAPLLRGRPVNIEWEPVDFSVRGDIQECYWAVTNVIKNAFEALSEQPERTVRLTCWKDSESAFLLVEDSGPGVPDEIKEKLFEPFTSGKKIGEGNGLGLAISRRNLRSWGGDLSLQKSSLGGAGFRLSFPL
jgi:C4-dicarboxylate-specific signal transduction histidine kinase